MEATPGFELARMCKMLFHVVQEIQHFQGLIVIRYYLALRGAENGVTVMVTPFFCVQG